MLLLLSLITRTVYGITQLPWGEESQANGYIIVQQNRRNKKLSLKTVTIAAPVMTNDSYTENVYTQT